MSQENNNASSPFAALTYQEQQARWLAWRSRQLDYRDVKEEPIQTEAAVQPPMEERQPLLRMPNMRIAPPPQRRELDHVLSRHRQAAKRAGSFHPTGIDAPIG